ncbi:MAG: hypothetical protein ACLQVG_26910 [Terriglobia bacterium]
MKRSALVLFAISFVCTSSMGKDQKGPDPALANIHKVFVKGNSEAAVRVRMVLNRVGKSGPNKSGCLELVSNAADADGVLEIEERAEPRNPNDVLPGLNSNHVSGTLTDKQGNVIWSGVKAGNNMPLAANHFVGALTQAAGCK